MVDPFEREYDHPDERKKQQRAITHVRDFAFASEQYRRNHLDLAKDAREQYETWQAAGKSRIGRANLKPPYLFTAIESQAPLLVEAFLREEPMIRFSGKNRIGFMTAPLMTDFHQSQLEAMDYEVHFIEFCKAILIDGTAIAKIPYRYEERVQAEPFDPESDVTESGEIERRHAPRVTQDGPTWENVPIYDFFPDPKCRVPGGIKYMRGLIHRVRRPFSHLKMNEKRIVDGVEVGVYENLDELKGSLQVKGSVHRAWSKPYWADEHAAEFERLNDNLSGVKDTDNIEVWEYWGLWDEKGDGNFQEYILVVANGDVLIRCELNFYDEKMKPFIASVNIPRTWEFYGIPEGTPIHSSIKEGTAVRNLRLDQLNLSVNRGWLLDKASGLKMNSFFARPGGVYMINDVNAMKPLEIGEPSAAVFREVDEINREIQSATGSIDQNPVLSRLAATFGRSATGVQKVNDIQASRIGIKARLLDVLALRRLAYIMFMTNRQFVNDDKEVELTDPDLIAQLGGNPFFVLPREAFTQTYTFKVSTNLRLSNDDIMRKTELTTQLIGMAEQSQPGSVKMDKFLEPALRALWGPQFKNFIRSDQERMALLQQSGAAQQATNAGIGQRTPQPNRGTP